MNFYASLNSSQICEQIIVTQRKLDGPAYIDIENYNDSLIWRKWDGKQWSNEKYEPYTNEKVEEKVEEIQEKVKVLNESITERDILIKDLEEKLAASQKINKVNLSALIELNDRVVELEG